MNVDAEIQGDELFLKRKKWLNGDKAILHLQQNFTLTFGQLSQHLFLLFRFKSVKITADGILHNTMH